MYGPWFNVGVVLLWLGTMTWLATTKILPSLLVGDPPSYQTILAGQDHEPPVAWILTLNGRKLGLALNTVAHTPDGLTQLHNRIHFDELPLAQLVPDLLQTLLSPESPLPTELPMEVVSTLVFDPLGRLSRFESSLKFQPEMDAIRVYGTAEGDQVNLSFHCGDSTYNTRLALPRKAMLYDGLSPNGRLPGLRVGQTWTMELYSPLRPPQEPVEILWARVESVQPIQWNGEMVDAFHVTYRTDPGASVGRSATPRVQLWVRPDGVVLVQQASVFNAKMTFTRLAD
jgi:hypothetical protein